MNTQVLNTIIKLCSVESIFLDKVEELPTSIMFTINAWHRLHNFPYASINSVDMEEDKNEECYMQAQYIIRKENFENFVLHNRSAFTKEP